LMHRDKGELVPESLVTRNAGKVLLVRSDLLAWTRPDSRAYCCRHQGGLRID
jgi:hypothetical protein